MSQGHHWLVSQIGAREHYAVARALHRAGRLDRLYTEAWCRYARNLLQKLPGPARSLANRYHRDIPNQRVTATTLSTLWHQLRRPSLDNLPDIERMCLEHIDIGRRFARTVAAHLARKPLEPARHAFFGYDTGCLETLTYLREKNILTVVDQIDPARVEEQLVYEESQRYEGWQKMPGRIPEVYWQRLSEEWRAASCVLVNSNWSKQALITQGVPESKIIIVPLAYEPASYDNQAPRLRRADDQPLHVLWLGSVILRKGIQYLLAAAKALANTNVKITVAGPILISQPHVDDAPANVEFVGRVSRDRASQLYRQADVFVLPTISDGFAITQIEAMAHGLPVIATPNCGEVVEHQVDGLIVPARDAHALAQAIATVADDRAMLSEMSRSALVKSRQFGLDQLQQRLEAAVASFQTAPPPDA